MFADCHLSVGNNATYSKKKLVIYKANVANVKIEVCSREMVEGEGFEPSKAVPADLQSDPFGHSGTPPRVDGILSNLLLM